MTDISFFIPAYNCSKTITEAVVSIMETNFNAGDELIIVNDCSTDDTPDVLALLKERYNKINIITHSRNKGGAAARNTAIENAGNELLFCLDSDNVLAAKSIPALKKYLIDNNADVASFQHQHYFLNDKYDPEYTWSLPAGDFPLQNYLKGENTPGQHGNYLFTKQSWQNAKGYAEGTGALDTWTFGLRQAITGAKIIVLEDTFYYHRLDYENSYWMRDAEANLWSVSLKATQALLPFFDIIDEKYITYMLGKGRYIWFYKLKKAPIKLVDRDAKKIFYNQLQLHTHQAIYPKATLLKRAINKLKRVLVYDSR